MKSGWKRRCFRKGKQHYWDHQPDDFSPNQMVSLCGCSADSMELITDDDQYPKCRICLKEIENYGKSQQPK